jgi:hypothetical protein
VGSFERCDLAAAGTVSRMKRESSGPFTRMRSALEGARGCDEDSGASRHILSIAHLSNQLIDVVEDSPHVRHHPSNRRGAFFVQHYQHFVGVKQEIGQAVCDAF